MKVQLPIGGYFGAEETAAGKWPLPDRFLYTKSARASFKRILGCMGITRVFAPYFTCDALLQPLQESGTPYSLYSIDSSFSIAALPEIGAQDLLVYIDYWGLKDSYSHQLADRFGSRLLLDATQAFFAFPNEDCPCFWMNSARKVFGVADGSFLFVPLGLRDPFRAQRHTSNTNYLTDHLRLRHRGEVQRGHSFFQQNEDLAGEGIGDVSEYSRDILQRIDFSASASRRRENYDLLYQRLGSRNQLPDGMLRLEADAVPFFYPYLPATGVKHEDLWEVGIYVPIFWKECLNRVAEGYEWEKKLTSDLLPLPVDHRYGAGEMEFVADSLSRLEK